MSLPTRSSPREDSLATLIRQSAMAAVPRVVAMQSWAPRSRAHGSFDREYWSYRMSRGFRSATWQQAAVGLQHVASLATTDAERTYLRDRARAGVEYWLRECAHRGAVDEWYRHERSYCATAFGLQGVCEYLRSQDSDGRVDVLTEHGDTIDAVATWLLARWNGTAANQNVASGTALVSLANLRGEGANSPLRKPILRVLSDQQPGGWLREYGGADFGYSLLCLDLLAVSARDGCETSLSVAARLLGFLRNFASRTGDLPWFLGSRATAHAACAGLGYFARELDDARLILTCLAQEPQRVVSRMTAYDDRYFAYFGFPALARAAAWGTGASVDDRASDDPNRRDLRMLKVDGFEVRRVGSRRLVVADRGKSLAIETRDGSYAHQLGYECHVGKKMVGSHAGSGSASDLGHRMVRISEFRPLEKWGLVVHSVLPLARWGWASQLIGTFAKTRLGRPRRRSRVLLQRTIHVEETRFRVDDVISRSPLTRIARLTEARAVPWHSPSAMGPTHHGEFVVAPLGGAEGDVTSQISWVYDTNTDSVHHLLISNDQAHERHAAARSYRDRHPDTG